MPASDPPVTLRLLTVADLPMLHDWLNRPHIVEWWGGEAERPTLDEVLRDYRPEAMAAERVTPYIAMLGDEPIGYAQSYVAMGSGDGWWEDETDPGVRGIDQSLADPGRLNQGLGTRLVRALVAQLFADPAVTKVQTDPAPHNARAIRCYEKAGFVGQGVVNTPDGPALYMVQTRDDFERRRRAESQVEILVAPAGFDDWGGLVALLRESFAFMDGRIDPPSSLTRMSVDDFRGKAADETLIVARDGGRLVGCAFAALRDDCVYVGKVAVAASARGRGVARAMFAAAEDLARRHGRACLELQTRIELVENHATFAALGFVKTAETAHPGYTRPTTITMRKALAGHGR